METTRRGFITAAALAAAAGAHRAAKAAPTGGKRFYKGQFHTHTYWSDGSAFPEQAIQFYRETGYNFLGLSDHNVYADTRRVKKVGKGKGFVRQEIFDAYKRDFPGCVETETAADGSLNVVIQPYAKMRKLFEKPGEFLLLDAVEGTTRVYDENGVEHQVHMNYLNVPGVPEHFRTCGTKASVAQRIADSLKAVEALAKEKGREPMFILNHPIWRWYDVTPEDLVANLYGVGNDDTHGYFGTVSHSPPGIHCIPYNAWSLVRAEALTAEALIRAMNAGDFAVCEGVQPEDFSFDAASGTLSVSVAGKKNLCRTIQFIVTKRDFSEKPVGTVSIEPPDAPEDKQKVYARTINIYDKKKIGCIAKAVSGGIGEGVKASYTMSSDDLYVRARILSPERPPVTAFQHPKVHVAWTQPYLRA